MESQSEVNVSAALEILSALAVLVAFVPAGAVLAGRVGLSLRAGTNNLVNAYVVSGLMTTTCPQRACLIELSEQL